MSLDRGLGLVPSAACAPLPPPSGRAWRWSLFAGIDTHKDSLAVTVVDAARRQHAGVQVVNAAAQLISAHWVGRIGVRGLRPGAPSANCGRNRLCGPTHDSVGSSCVR